MAVSVRMDPLLEIELQQAAERQGVTKSQFIIAAVERALGRKNPYELMQQLKAEEPRAKYKVTQQPYDSVAAKAALRKKLKAKHNAGSAG
jgi:predicted DNA-binding protein